MINIWCIAQALKNVVHCDLTNTDNLIDEIVDELAMRTSMQGTFSIYYDLLHIAIHT